jgi:phosphohistidine phosphatase
MKYLYLVRHAKSSWDFPELSDFDRPLNKRGQRDAPVMALRVASKQPDLDVIISSPANRAITTAKEMAKALDIDESSIVQEHEIYHASMKTLIDIAKALPEEYDKVMLVGHNPGFTDLANQLKEHDYHIDNVPTCGVVAIELPTHKWADLVEHSGRLLFFDYPKKVL